ncbi:MAG: hypothetical protein COB78_13410 [Hyphomicrobiales bacterium]|nr:MAG: hypothetical protein COB78_13410 [Hyphomicrobiales bacterium]
MNLVFVFLVSALVIFALIIAGKYIVKANRFLLFHPNEPVRLAVIFIITVTAVILFKWFD